MTPRADLEVIGVSKTFGRQRVLAEVDLSVPAGSFVALMGPNGAGKTTLLRLASGLAVPTSGRVTLAGVDLRRAGPGLRRMVGFVSHDGLLYGDLTARANLMLHARLFGLADPAGAVESVADLLAIQPVLDRPAAVLSRGNRQRVTLARALLHDPAVLFLDEPFTGLDDQSSRRLVVLLRQLHEQGRTVVMTTHDAARTADGPTRLVVLERGRVVTDRALDAEQPERPRVPVGVPSGVAVGAAGEESAQPASPPSGGAAGVAGVAEDADPVAPPAGRGAFTRPPGWFRSALLVAGKDLAVEARSRDVLGAGGLFAVVVLVTASFVLPPGGGRQGMATGILWISLLFAVLLGVGRTMARESQDRAIEGLLLSPAPRESIFLGKAVAGLVMMAGIELFVVPLFLVLMADGGSGASSGPLALLLTVLLSTVGLVTVATLFSGIAVGSRVGESLLPLIVMPVVIPLMIAAVETTGRALGGGGSGAGDLTRWYLLIAGFDVIVGLAAVATFSFVVEE